MTIQTLVNLAIDFLVVIAVVGLVLKSFVTVEQQTIVIVERFRKYKKTLPAGLGFKVPIIDKIAGRLSLRLSQAIVSVNVKTKDNVFADIVLSVQYQVVQELATDAFYKLQDPIKQIESFVFNIVRSEVPKLGLEEVFQNQDHIALAVDKQLGETMKGFGYSIYKVLVTGINPAENVARAMNAIKASEQLKIATTNKAEADKIITVKKAEAESESKRLQGEGIAKERAAIVEGLKNSVEEMSEATGTNPKEAMQLLLVTQYFDTLKAVGSGSGKTLLLPYSASGASKISEEIRNSIIVANESKE